MTYSEIMAQLVHMHSTESFFVEFMYNAAAQRCMHKVVFCWICFARPAFLHDVVCTKLFSVGFVMHDMCLHGVVFRGVYPAISCMTVSAQRRFLLSSSCTSLPARLNFPWNSIRIPRKSRFSCRQRFSCRRTQAPLRHVESASKAPRRHPQGSLTQLEGTSQAFEVLALSIISCQMIPNLFPDFPGVSKTFSRCFQHFQVVSHIFKIFPAFPG